MLFTRESSFTGGFWPYPTSSRSPKERSFSVLRRVRSRRTSATGKGNGLDFIHVIAVPAIPGLVVHAEGTVTQDFIDFTNRLKIDNVPEADVPGITVGIMIIMSLSRRRIM